jgi:hypothetical protein
MLNELKIMLAEMRKLQALEEALPVVSNNPQINFDELVGLEREHRFGIIIKGEAGLFTIITRPHNIMLIFWAVFVFYVPVSSLFAQSLDKLELITMFVMIAVMFFFYRFGSTTYNITIDSYQKLIILKSNNLIGRFIKPDVNVDFRELTDITGQSIYQDDRPNINKYYKLTMHFSGQKKTLMYLAERNNGNANQKLFVSHLKSMIRNNT